MKSSIDFDNPTEFKDFTKYLALASAMKTPLPKNEHNISIDRNQLPRIYDDKDSITLRLQFLAFIRDLWALVMPPSSNLLKGYQMDVLGEVMKHPDLANDEDRAYELIIHAFSDAVHTIIFCDWLQASRKDDQAHFLQRNFRFTIELPDDLKHKYSKKADKTTPINFQHRLIHARGEYIIL